MVSVDSVITLIDLPPEDAERFEQAERVIRELAAKRLGPNWVFVYTLPIQIGSCEIRVCHPTAKPA